jgi:hypothetical protein
MINRAPEDNEKKWIIQRCIDAWTNHYEDWPGFCEQPMTYSEMMVALKECDERWLEYEFRGHNIHHGHKVGSLRPAATFTGNASL